MYVAITKAGGLEGAYCSTPEDIVYSVFELSKSNMQLLHF